MASLIKSGRTAFRLIALATFVVAALVGPAPAKAQSQNVALGGPKGLVKSSKGDLLEGMMVQLISKTTAIRTTVFSNAEGRYEFPKLDAGDYTLRIARPMEFFPYAKDNVHIDGAAQLDDITLARMTNTELLPPLHDVAAQMTGAEWLLSLSGTGEQKALLTNYCNWCHSYQQIFRNHYDEQSWTKIIYRMTHGAGSPLVNIREPGRLSKDDEAKLVHWLATVRGPDSPDPDFVTLPRPQGRATRVVITEYELPRLDIATHDVAGDAQGRPGIRRTAAPMSAASIRAPGWSRNSTCRRRVRGNCRARIGSPSTRTASSGARRTGRTTSGVSTRPQWTSSASHGPSRNR